jgi:predicted CXXCH cytochrome family protein
MIGTTLRSCVGLITVCGLFILPGSAWAQDITGSSHDMSSAGWNTTGEICVVCHTPHSADTTVSAAPLWNHEVTTETFTPYSSGTLDATPGQPDESSKLCLSCHDGSVALDNFGGATGGTNFIAAAADVGIDLSDDHPVSFDYTDALATTDGGLHPPTTTASGLGGTIDEDMLISNKMQCASCHNPHKEVGVATFLIKDNAGSDLCLTCHNK